MNSFTPQRSDEAIILTLQVMTLSTQNLRDLPRLTQLLASHLQAFLLKTCHTLSPATPHCPPGCVSRSHRVCECKEEDSRSALSTGQLASLRTFQGLNTLLGARIQRQINYLPIFKEFIVGGDVTLLMISV